MNTKLTKNQKLVLSVLQQEKAPLSAYTILDRLRHEGLKAPLQIYRALEKLLETKHIHRLESVHAFVICTHHHNCQHQLATFTICKKCGKAQEIEDDNLALHVKRITEKHHFIPHDSYFEIHGICKSCQTH